MKFPEIRVTRTGARIAKVEWDPLIHGAPFFDITEMRVMKVERQIRADDGVPEVRLTLMARLVEFEEDDPRGSQESST